MLAERPVPEPARGEVLIKVAAAGLNRADILQRRGFYPSPPGAPSYPGLEVSGTVAALGDGVTSSRSATRSARCSRAAATPSTVASTQARCCRFPGRSTWSRPLHCRKRCSRCGATCFGFGRLQPGETLLVHGGSSGIGVAAIQLAAALRAYGVRNGGLGRQVPFLREPRRAARDRLQDRRLRRRDRQGNRRARRQRRARHGRRQLCRAQSAGARAPKAGS